MLKKLLYLLVEGIAKVHDKILTLNDAFEYTFTDKELHFIIIAIIGIAILFVIHPLFVALSKKHVMVISWIYVTTLIVVITFAIEIGQKITNTGNMEFADIMFGIIGFFTAFFAFCFVRGIWHFIIKMINKNKKKKMLEYRRTLKEKNAIDVIEE